MSAGNRNSTCKCGSGKKSKHCCARADQRTLGPQHADTSYQLANSLRAQGDPEGAAKHYLAAISFRPEFAAAHNGLGEILMDCGRLDDAEQYLRQAVLLNKNYAGTFNNLGIVLTELKRHTDAEACLRQALLIEPNFAEVHSNLGRCLKAQHRLFEAEASLKRAVALAPSMLAALNNLGSLYTLQGQFSEAERTLRLACTLKPDSAIVHHNLGSLFLQEQRFAEAESSYRTAIDFGLKDAEYSLATLLLSLERYTEGWHYYESRYHAHKTVKIVTLPAQLPFPQWQGESLSGKSLLVCPEQGQGDQIQFVRYVPLLKQLGVTRLTVACYAPLKPLFESIDGVDEVITRYQDAAAHDYWTLLLSIPCHMHYAIGITPARLPYLHVDSQRADQWRPHLPKEGLRVGLAWKGSPSHENDVNRSLPGLAVLDPLWTVPGIQFVSIQKGEGEGEAVLDHEQHPILPLGPEIQDFADTAAIVAQLDLVICVDTAVAHLAGALNKPCWVLLPAIATDWRWLLKRSDSPWYSSVRLFRQQKRDNWTAVISEVTAALQQFVQLSRNGAATSSCDGSVRK